MCRSRRPICESCSFLTSQCVCQWIPTINNALPVLVIQDPKEAKHAKNTLKLMRLALPSLRCISSEDSEELRGVLDTLSLDRWRLVFPSEGSIPIEQVSIEEKKDVDGIVLIDATWRKAKRLFWSVPKLQEMVSWHFVSPPHNTYTIRRSPRGEALSTLEACAYAIEQLTQNDMQPLRDFMVSAQSFQWRQQPADHQHRKS
ncbi:DTW domain protein [Marinomonas spartinae]|uniref:tRNA-uridine aminocarboxypropyltransferase n=1 Tax=Marinomonas spartinae TaxID=1792290 RepID=A0A1A8TE84_9GAMM|nr:tRNA-uridine aminocarboxypropyltransferase [Marinomonas spartinae]SBS31559.1 DTW domain protein [Marinomonas spartinae]